MNTASPTRSLLSDSADAPRWLDALTGPVGRALYALPFAVFGVFHLTQGPAMAAMVPGWLPGGVFWVYLTGTAMLAASVAMLVGRLQRAAGLGLALLMLTFVVTVHLPNLANPQMAQISTILLLKDLALAGGALMIAGRR